VRASFVQCGRNVGEHTKGAQGGLADTYARSAVKDQAAERECLVCPVSCVSQG
jgi:hypothetical protein